MTSAKPANTDFHVSCSLGGAGLAATKRRAAPHILAGGQGVHKGNFEGRTSLFTGNEDHEHKSGD